MVMWRTCRQNNSQRRASGQASLLLLFSDPAFRPTFLQQPWNFHFKMRVWQHMCIKAVKMHSRYHLKVGMLSS